MLKIPDDVYPERRFVLMEGKFQRFSKDYENQRKTLRFSQDD